MIERLLILLLVNILFFFKSVTYKYSSDDITVFHNPPKSRNRWERRLFQLEGRLRVAPDQDHALTTFLHAFVCCFIYLGFGASDTSFLAALLFSFNPINNQGSVWISGRGYVLSNLGLLMSLSFPILAPLFLLGATYYTAGFFMPLVFFGSATPWVAWFIPLIWLFNWKRFRGTVSGRIKAEMFGEDKKIKPQKLVLAIKTFGFYLTHSLIPIKNTFYHSFLQSASGNDIMKKKAYTMNCRFFWIGIASISAILYKFFFMPWDIVSFSLLWWCIGIAPFCNLFRFNQEIAERYTYIPNAGLMFVLAYILVGHPIITAFFLGMYATKLWFYMDAYLDDYFLVEFACMNSPSSWFAWHVRAMKRWDSGSYKEALILWTMAKIISPKEMKVLFNIATVLKLAGNHKEAEEYLKQAESNIPLGQEKDFTRIVTDWRSGKYSVLL